MVDLVRRPTLILVGCLMVAVSCSRATYNSEAALGRDPDGSWRVHLTRCAQARVRQVDVGTRDAAIWSTRTDAPADVEEIVLGQVPPGFSESGRWAPPPEGEETFVWVTTVGTADSATEVIVAPFQFDLGNPPDPGYVLRGSREVTLASFRYDAGHLGPCMSSFQRYGAAWAFLAVAVLAPAAFLAWFFTSRRRAAKAGAGSGD